MNMILRSLQSDLYLIIDIWEYKGMVLFLIYILHRNIVLIYREYLISLDTSFVL